MIFSALFIALCLILAGYLYESSPWRHCRRCGCYWNIKTKRWYNYLPESADGITKPQECDFCKKV